MYNERAIRKVLTCLYNDNDLIVSPEHPFRLEDFALKKYQAIYSALYNLYALGNNNIDISDIIAYFQQQQIIYSKFVEDGGMDVLYEICNDNSTPNFSYNYSLIKKYSLINDLQKNGIDISDIYDVTLPADKLEKQLAEFNAMEVEDIFKHYNLKLNTIQNKYEVFLEKTCINAADHIEELLKQLQTVPEVGLPLCGGIYNTVTRGARLKKLYIDSGSSGSGKSRRMVGNACNLAIPMYYDTITEEWINTSCNNKVLYITTELEHTLTTAHHSGFRPVVVHEFGHSFAGLADEYYYDDMYSPYYFPDVEPWEQNITTMADFGSKWADMMPADARKDADGHYLPTPPVDDSAMWKSIAEGADTDSIVGVYEGGGYLSKGVFRPYPDCRMKSNVGPMFCPVCQRAIERIILFGLEESE